MNVNKISKIFVEQDEEIVFVVENIINATNDRVILVIPNVSSLTSSVVSLKILSKQIVKSSRLVVLVCDNNNAKHLCEKAGLAVRAKISEVDKDSWAEAKTLKEQLLDIEEKTKKELLGARTPGSESDSPAIKEGVVTAKVIDDEPEKSTKEEIKPILEKPRLKPKVIDVNGIKFFAGGDITETPDLLDIERRRLNEEGEFAEDDEFTTDDEEGELVGTDLSSIYKKKKTLKASLPKIKFQTPGFIKKLVDSGWGLKLIIGGVLLFIIISLVLYFGYSKVTFTVYLEKTTQAIKKTITADSAAQQIIPDKYIITAEVFTKSGTLKGEAEPTGQGKTGDKATGEVTIFNVTTSAVNLPAGTVLIEQKTGKSYRFVTNAAVTVPAAEGTDAGDIAVAVTAETFGTEYNMTDTVTYKVGSYSMGDVNGKSFVDFTKGTSVDTIVVSKTDIEALKATLTDQLERDLSTQLESLLAEDDILLNGSETFKEDSFTTSAKENDVLPTPTGTTTTNPKFEAELKLTVTALKISKSELRQIAEEIVKLEKQPEDQEITVQLTDPIIENVKVEGTKATFDLRANATIYPVLKEDELVGLVLGKGVDEAKALLGRFNGVKDVRSRYNIIYIPYSWQKVSDDTSRVTVVIEDYND